MADQLCGTAVVHGELIHVHRRDVQPRTRQQIARVAHLQPTSDMS